MIPGPSGYPARFLPTLTLVDLMNAASSSLKGGALRDLIVISETCLAVCPNLWYSSTTLSMSGANTLYESSLPAYTPTPESTFLQPEKIHVLNDTPYLSFLSLSYSHTPGVRCLLSRDLQSAGNSGKSTKSSGDIRLDPHLVVFSGFGVASVAYDELPVQPIYTLYSLFIVIRD